MSRWPLFVLTLVFGPILAIWQQIAHWRMRRGFQRRRAPAPTSDRWKNVDIECHKAACRGATLFKFDFYNSPAHPERPDRITEKGVLEALEFVSVRPETGELENAGISARFRHHGHHQILEIFVKNAVSLYGLGAGPGGFSRNNASMLLLNRDTMFYMLPGGSYTSFPFVLARDGGRFTGVLWNSCLPAHASTHNAAGGAHVRFEPLHGHINGSEVFVLRGSAYEILDALTHLTGRPALPPAWAAGFHQSRWSYANAREVEAVAWGMEKHGIPCDALYFDIHYMHHYRVFSWSPRRFPDPEGLLSRLRERGLRGVAIVDPGIKKDPDYAAYREGMERGYFCRNEAGEVYEGKVWPGKCVFPDFTREEVRRWWGEWNQKLLARGVSGIWNDMNEPVLRINNSRDPLREDVRHATGPHWSARNKYANLEAESAYEAMTAFSEERPFILSRSGTCGIQKYAAVWTGDNQTSWRHLRENLNMVLNLGLCGVPVSGADVGGFASGARVPAVFRTHKLFKNPELFARWVQLGSLMPFFRVHTTRYSYRQEPWSFGRKTLAIARKHIRRRYQLLPYLYSLLWEAHRTGAPVIRPLFMDYPELSDSADQFLVGSALLAAPILRPRAAARRVLLPGGTWTDFETGETYHAREGGEEFLLPAKLESFPLLVKAGTALPLAEPGGNAEATLSGDPIFEIYASPDAPLHGGSWVDDGLTDPRVRDTALSIRLSGPAPGEGPLALKIEVQSTRDMSERRIRLRVPPGFREALLPGGRVNGRPADCGPENRGIRWREYRLPLRSCEVEFRRE